MGKKRHSSHAKISTYVYTLSLGKKSVTSYSYNMACTELLFSKTYSMEEGTKKVTEV